MTHRVWLHVSVLILVLAVSCNGDDGPTDGLAPSPTLAVETAVAPSGSSEEESREAAQPASSEAEVDEVLPNLAPTPGLLYVYFFDISLGDAIYIRTPTGEDVIIDGGDSRNELSILLDQLNEGAIDVVIASHPHADHIGGLPRLITERQVGSVWSNGETYTTQVYKDLKAAIAAKGLTENAGHPGDTFTLGGVAFTFLAPARIGSNINDNSLVVRMECGESSFLFTGDAEKSSEDLMIVTEQALLDVDVLKLSHHGSRYATSSELILATTPRLAIYQARVGNQYGHPHPETLVRLADKGVPVFGTGLAKGTVVVSTACDDQFSISPHLDGFADLAVLAAPPTSAPPPEVPTSAARAAPTSAPQPTVPPSAPPTATIGASNCHPSYQGGVDVATGGCIRQGVGDYDCYPGSGNGPNYVRGPVTVVGPDEFGLDTDDPDSIGCEPG